jgi:hypothetical protein
VARQATCQDRIVFFAIIVSIDTIKQGEYSRYPSPGSKVYQIQFSSFYLPIPTSAFLELPSSLDVEHRVLLPIVSVWILSLGLSVGRPSSSRLPSLPVWPVLSALPCTSGP